MCGIAGVTGPAAADPDVITRMSACLSHRGPDGTGIWSDGPVTLAHRRLAVLGLGDVGAQPMHSASGRHTLVHNGEIYNHLDLRAELSATGRAPAWRGGSDTETLLAAFDAWGLEATLDQCVGMFALGLYDREQRSLSLARDRLGEKPLYWAWHERSMLFASQPSALRRVPGFTTTIDPDALAELLRHTHVPGSRTIHREIHEVRPGTLLHVPIEGDVPGAPVEHTWWSFDALARAGVADPLEVDDATCIDTVEEAVRTAVRTQLISDVPLGAFLSGGIDSSLVVASMRAVSSSPVRTFTIGFAQAGFDESVHARAVAAHLGTEHTELIVTDQDVLAVVPELPRIYDEPFADSSQIPTVLVSRLARASVTVALSGDGGDELFGGYERYALLERHLRTPRPVALAGAALYTLRGDRRRAVTAGALGLGPGPIVRRLLSEGVFAGRLVPRADHDAVARRALQRWEATAGLGGPTARSMAMDTVGYLPDDILHKVDRASMSVALETRVPMLDHRLVGLAWRLPHHQRVREGTGKWVLREALARHVPRDLFERPKAGFAPPLGAWLRGPLSTWADGLLAPDAVDASLLDAREVARLWRTHRSGRHDMSRDLWPLLMFQAWLHT